MASHATPRRRRGGQQPQPQQQWRHYASRHDRRERHACVKQTTRHDIHATPSRNAHVIQRHYKQQQQQQQHAPVLYNSNGNRISSSSSSHTRRRRRRPRHDHRRHRSHRRTRHDDDSDDDDSDESNMLSNSGSNNSDDSSSGRSDGSRRRRRRRRYDDDVDDSADKRAAQTTRRSPLPLPLPSPSSPMLQQQQQQHARGVFALDARLHELLQCVTPSSATRQRTLAVVADVQRVLRPLGLTLALYGSVRTGLLTPHSDVDCVMLPLGHADALPPRSSRNNKSDNDDDDDDDDDEDDVYSHGSDDDDSDDDDDHWHRHRRRHRHHDGNNSSRRHHGQQPSSSPSSPPRMPPALRRVLDVLQSDDGDGNDHATTTTAATATSMYATAMAGCTRRERQGCYAAGVRVVAQAMRASRAFHGVVAIAHARVPIVKCVHRRHGVRVDLGFTRDGCATSTYLCTQLRAAGNEYVRALTVLVKLLLSQWQLDDASTGGLGSFPVTLMVLWFVQSEVRPHYAAELQRSLGALLAGFLHYYGTRFDHCRAGIDVTRHTTFAKPAAAELYVVNPMKPGTNCAKAATRYASEVVPRFRHAAQLFRGLLEQQQQQQQQQAAATASNDAALCAALQRCFSHAVPACAGDSWAHVRRTAAAAAATDDGRGRRHRRRTQHQWTRGQQLYTGSLLDSSSNNDDDVVTVTHASETV